MEKRRNDSKTEQNNSEGTSQKCVWKFERASVSPCLRGDPLLRNGSRREIRDVVAALAGRVIRVRPEDAVRAGGPEDIRTDVERRFAGIDLAVGVGVAEHGRHCLLA